MSTPNHTPGPWTLERDRAKSLSIYAGITFVGEVYNEVDEPSAQENANAHLIAAAPAMYEALKDSLVLLEASYHDMHDKFGAHDLGTLTVFDCVEKVKATLAQAEAKS